MERDRRERTARRHIAAAKDFAGSKEYLDAIAELRMVPVESERYDGAQDLMVSYRNKMAAAEEKLRKAELKKAEAALAGKPKLKARIAVTDFEAIGGLEKGLGEAISENLRTGMIELQKFYVLERAFLKKVMEQQKLQLAGITDPSQAVEIGKLMATKYVVLGSVTKLGSTLTINLRFIDVETGMAELATKIRGKGEDALPEMIDDLVAQVNRKEL